MPTFSLNTIIFNTGTDKRLDGIVNDSLSAGVQNLYRGSDGNVYNTLAALMSQSPRLSYDTLHIQDHLAYISLAGKALNTGTPETLDAYFAENDTDSTRKATGIKCQINAGILVPRSLRLAQNEAASLSCEMIMRAKGATAPFALTDDESLPTADTIDEWFTLGAVTVNGNDVGNVQEASIDFGIEVVPIMGDGKVYPVELYIRRIVPTITFTTLTADQSVVYGIGGDNQVVTVTAQKGANAGRAGSGDKVFTSDASRVTWESLGSNHEGEAVLQCTAVCASSDGTTAPLAMA